MLTQNATREHFDLQIAFRKSVYGVPRTFPINLNNLLRFRILSSKLLKHFHQIKITILPSPFIINRFDQRFFMDFRKYSFELEPLGDAKIIYLHATNTTHRFLYSPDLKSAIYKLVFAMSNETLSVYQLPRNH